MKKGVVLKSCLASCLAALPIQASAITLDPALAAIIVERLNVESTEVTATARITDDLGADSLDVVELMMSVEEYYSISIPDAHCQNIQTVADLQTVVNGGISPSGYCPHT